MVIYYKKIYTIKIITENIIKKLKLTYIRISSCFKIKCSNQSGLLSSAKEVKSNEDPIQNDLSEFFSSESVEISKF